MNTSAFRTRQAWIILAAAALFVACSNEAPLSPSAQSARGTQLTELPAKDAYKELLTLRQVTARFQDLNVALAEGFVLLHDCEVRPGEGQVGAVYVHPVRLMDGQIDAELPDALIYEPNASGPAKLVGVEFAIPYALWPEPTLPKFLGATFQDEPEFGVFALHAWVWRSNPNGMFAETNPRVSCGTT